MGNTFMLALANIRKNKGSAVTLLAFILIAATLLYLGLMLFVEFGNHFDVRSEQLHAPHAVVLQSQDITTDSQDDFLKQYPGVTEVERQSVVAGYGDYYMNGAKAVAILLFVNASDRQTMNPPQCIGPSVPLEENSIYVPYLMKVAGGYEIGDRYQINLSGKELYFTIAGFTEEIPFGALMNNLYRFYISDATYATLANLFPEHLSSLQSVRMEESDRGTQIQLDYVKEFFYSQNMDNASSLFVFSMSYAIIKSARTFIPMIMSILVIAFAIVLLFVSLIVIRFRIINSIEEEMTNIGALKAVGYQSRQIIASILWQFGVVALLGGILGIVFACFVLPTIGEILETQSALIWSPAFHLGWAVVTLLFLLLSVAVISFLVARRIRKLSPLVALQRGMQTHNFKKNRAPLEKSHGPVSFLLARKQLLNNKKQAVMIAVIIAFVSFMSVAAMSVYYNIGIETDAFVSVIVGEKPDAGLLLKDGNGADAIIERINARPEVRKAFGYQNVSLLADGYNVSAFITKDFSVLEGVMLYDGRYPKYENEVALGGLLSQSTGKNIGDSILIKQGENEKEFLVTGIVQMMENSGINMVMTYDGLLSIQSDYQFNQIYVYLTEKADAKNFIQSVQNAEGDIFSSTVDMNELIDAQFSAYGSIFAAVAFGMLSVTVLVVILVLYLVIKAAILQKKRELGIQKALGYTTIQLMTQITLSFVPIVLFGVLLGGLGGHFGFNTLFAALMRNAGIIETHLPSPTMWTMLTCLALAVIAYLVSLLITWRIRKVSPYTLVSE